MQSSTSHRMSCLYSNVDDYNHLSGYESVEEDFTEEDCMYEYSCYPFGTQEISCIHSFVNDLTLLDQSLYYTFRIYLMKGNQLQSQEQHYVELKVHSCDQHGKSDFITDPFIDRHCTLADLDAWTEISQVLYRACFIKFVFVHYSQSRYNENQRIDESWTDTGFRCLRLVMKAVESNESIVHLEYMPYYHPKFHNIQLDQFGKNKVTESLKIFPHNHRYGNHDWVYNQILSGYYNNKLVSLDIANGLIHPYDYGYLEALYPRMMKIERVKLLLPVNCDIPNLSMMLGPCHSRVQALDVCFDDNLTVEKLRQFGECIRNSCVLKELRITIGTDLRQELSDMLRGTKLDKCVVSFNNNLKVFHSGVVDSDLIKFGINGDRFDGADSVCVELINVVFSRGNVQDSMRSEHRLVVEIEGNHSQTLREGNALNKLVQSGTMSEEHCRIKKAAMSCCRTTYFDAVKEMGSLNKSVVFLILLMLAKKKKGDQNIDSAGDQSNDNDDIQLDPTQALSAVFKIVRHLDIIGSNENINRAGKRAKIIELNTINHI